MSIQSHPSNILAPVQKPQNLHNYLRFYPIIKSEALRMQKRGAVPPIRSPARPNLPRHSFVSSRPGGSFRSVIYCVIYSVEQKFYLTVETLGGIEGGGGGQRRECAADLQEVDGASSLCS